MSNTKDLYEQIKSLYEAFDENHNQNVETGTKASGTRARKAIGEIKKLATEYRKASVAESKRIDQSYLLKYNIIMKNTENTIKVETEVKPPKKKVGS